MRQVLVCAVLFVPFFLFPVGSQNELDRGVTLATDGRYSEALEIFSKELAEKPDDPLLNYYVGITQHYLENEERAIEFLSKAVSEGAEFPEAYYWLTRALMEVEESERASKVLALGQSRFPKNEKLIELSKRMTSR